ncbi:MAG TPA: hypothetical protein PLM95_18185, partial [Ottowia sp.]|nr:hypothetical protein [Ottowia sp.]
MSEVEVPSLLPLAVRARLAQARRLTTPCGDGHIVWHAWEPEGARRASVAPRTVLWWNRASALPSGARCSAATAAAG